jgi:hypothetical protein
MDPTDPDPQHCRKGKKRAKINCFLDAAYALLTLLPLLLRLLLDELLAPAPRLLLFLLLASPLLLLVGSSFPFTSISDPY